MAQVLVKPLVATSKFRGWISLKANGCLPSENYSCVKTLACHNRPIVDDSKTLESNALKIEHMEHKISQKPDYVHPVSVIEKETVDETDKRIDELVAEIKGLFNSMEDGEISSSAYDTAWIARIPVIDGSAQPRFPQLLDWILHNQLSDGSWGENSRFLACDRLLNTLSCLVTLAIWGVGNNQVKRGVEFLRRNAEDMIKEALCHHHSKGFEMVFPALLHEAEILGLGIPYELSIIKQINENRGFELKKVSVEELHRHPSAMLQCLEGMQELVDWNNILNLQSKDGSFSGSPASTACVFMHTRDHKCLRFLTSLVTNFGDHVPCMYPVDIAERLRAVDCVERLGLERHFEKEIKQALDYVFQYWTDRGVGFGRESLVPDIDITATAFRLLRTFGYSVSSEVLQTMKGETEEILKLSGNENSARVIAILNLYRCSQLNFPGENSMKEIGAFAKDYLAEFLKSKNFSQAKAVKKNLLQEIEYALSARWNRNLPRLMSRNQIELFDPDDLWLEKTLYRMPNASNEKYLELAKLDFNHVQATHRSEIQDIKRWYQNCNFPRLDFVRHREVVIYWTATAVMFEPEYSECRLDYAKAGILATILDDLNDSYGSIEQLKLFNEAFERWDPLIIEQLPEEMKIVFMGLYNTLTDVSERVREIQGRDVLPYLCRKWSKLLISFTKEREWTERSYSPPLDEYWENAQISGAMETTIVTSLFSTGEILPDHILDKIDFVDLVSQIGRLTNDFRTFQRERDLGEVASFVQCYMNEHPECNEEDALKYMERVDEEALTNLNYHFLMRSDVPKCYRSLLFNTARIMEFIYRKEDGFSNAAEDLKDSIKLSIFDPVL